MSENDEKTGKEKSLDNLKEFQPGQSGNPNGRPKGVKDGPRAMARRWGRKQIRGDLLKVFQAKGMDLEFGTNDEMAMEILGHEIAKSNVQAIKMYWDMAEFPHPREMGLTGDFIVNFSPEDAAML